jgi:hypothetical protein
MSFVKQRPLSWCGEPSFPTNGPKVYLLFTSNVLQPKKYVSSCSPGHTRLFSIHSLLAAVAAPLGCAFTISFLTNSISGEVVEINWAFSANDPLTSNPFLTKSTNVFERKDIIGQNL